MNPAEEKAESLRVMRGIVIGLGISLALWAMLGAIVFVVIQMFS